MVKPILESLDYLSELRKEQTRLRRIIKEKKTEDGLPVDPNGLPEIEQRDREISAILNGEWFWQ